ncbi:MAG: HNH endonuclease [Synergistaceae bacterium]|nr:HNH endonuclease [Synergistaceae bacterium]
MRQSFPAEREVEAAGTVEGAKKVVYTTTYERDPKVRRAFLKGKHLKCEVCGFDFEKAYGKLGAGYIEVHHKRPVSEGVRMTDLDNDLAMLCSNCHRMIHRGRDHMITLEELKGIIKKRRNTPSFSYGDISRNIV